MPALIAVGEDSFVEMKRLQLEYVDKTRFIQDVLDDEGTRVLLLPRPRRFGKTLNMTMLDAFLARREEDYSPLFEGLYIAGAGEKYWQHFGRYPTIFLTFKSVKPESIEAWERAIRQKISDIARDFEAVLRPSLLNRVEVAEFDALLEKRAEDVLEQGALLRFSHWLHRATGEKVLILVDEYDSPIHAAWLADQQAGRIMEPRPGERVSPDSCYRAVVDFYRVFFGAALKSNPHLFKGILTGILRVSKESIFSDLNNIRVCSLLDYAHRDAFGFTEPEVIALCERQGQVDHFPVIREWYNGYRFANEVIYNPWSVLYFLKEHDKTPRAYWINSSGNTLIKHQLATHAVAMHEDFQTLLEGGSIVRRVKPNFVFTDLDRSVDAVYSLLLFSGYLKASQLPAPVGEPADHALSIPNREVREIYLESFQQWLADQLGGTGTRVNDLIRAILDGDEEQLEGLLGTLAASILSIHDGGGVYAESLYHGLMIGLLASVTKPYRVVSNRESGAGRPDLMIVPTRPGLPGAVLELKVTRRKKNPTLELALQAGLDQLAANNYRAELEAMGAHPIHLYAVAFDGKTVKVERVESPE